MIKGSFIYLDQNIYGRLVDGKMPSAVFARLFFKNLGKSSEHSLPYSSAHIFEVLNIPKDRPEYRTKHLEVIKEISEGKCITFRSDIDRYIIRPQCPFELF